jgi:hypothetical protein
MADPSSMMTAILVIVIIILILMIIFVTILIAVSIKVNGLIVKADRTLDLLANLLIHI